MSGLRRKSKLIRHLRREAGAVLRLGPWLLLALLLVLILWQADTAALSGLFQSPPTDTPTVPATDTPLPTPTLMITATATTVMTSTPTVVPSDTPTTVPSETPTLAPSQTPVISPTQTLTPALTTSPAGGEGAEEAEPGSQRYPQGESNLNFEWGMLFDSVALAFSYVWLCCGAFIVLGVPLFFVVLWVASTARRQKTE